MATLNGHDVRNTAGDVFESNDKIIVILRVSLVSFLHSALTVTRPKQTGIVRYVDETPKYTGTPTNPSSGSNQPLNSPAPPTPPTLSRPTLPGTDSEPNCTAWSQTGPSETYLLRYFVEELARWVLTYQLPECTLFSLLTNSSSISGTPSTTSQV